jgi:CubicO group peptidase (beta-lactamase class C family)
LAIQRIEYEYGETATIENLFSVFVLFAANYFFGCKDGSPRVNQFGFRQQNYVYKIPEKTDDGWDVSSLQEEGLDPMLISECMRRVVVESYKNIHSTLIVKNGKLVLEEYFYGYHKDKNHRISSATKSIGSVLTGIAIDKGLLKNAEVTLYPYFINDAIDTEWDDWSKTVTVKHLLTMTSGYDCDDHRTDFACEHEMYKTNDWLKYALNLSMSYPPGTHWAYNSTSLILVGEIISRQSGMSISDFADQTLFGPLEITDFKWGLSPKGRAWLAGNARMKPRDMARFGIMVLNNGKWKGRQIVSPAWLRSLHHIGYLPDSYCWISPSRPYSPTRRDLSRLGPV